MCYIAHLHSVREQLTIELDILAQLNSWGGQNVFMIKFVVCHSDVQQSRLLQVS